MIGPTLNPLLVIRSHGLACYGVARLLAAVQVGFIPRREVLQIIERAEFDLTGYDLRLRLEEFAILGRVFEPGRFPTPVTIPEKPQAEMPTRDPFSGYDFAGH